MKYDSYMYTNRGGRSHNEDYAKIKDDNGAALFIVADGLGGHGYGEIASKCVADSLTEEWDYSSEKSIDEMLNIGILKANGMLLDLQEEKQSTMKSTVAALALKESRAAWAYVGDTRLYYIHKNAICHITEDHSVAYKKYKAGEITKDEIARDEDQPCLLRTLGGRERFEPDVHLHGDAIEENDAFLICTDGAWEYLQDEEILIDYLKAGSAKEWVESLLLRIISRIEAQNDNLTLLSVIVS